MRFIRQILGQDFEWVKSHILELDTINQLIVFNFIPKWIYIIDYKQGYFYCAGEKS